MRLISAAGAPRNADEAAGPAAGRVSRRHPHHHDVREADGPLQGHGDRYQGRRLLVHSLGWGIAQYPTVIITWLGGGVSPSLRRPGDRRQDSSLMFRALCPPPVAGLAAVALAGCGGLPALGMIKKNPSTSTPKPQSPTGRRFRRCGCGRGTWRTTSASS